MNSSKLAFKEKMMYAFKLSMWDYCGVKRFQNGGEETVVK